MIVWLLRLSLLGQVLLAVALSWWLDRQWAAVFPLPGSIAVAFMAVALVHPLFVCSQFVLARLLATPVPAERRIGVWRAIKTLDAELDASLRLFCWTMPFRASVPVPAPTAPLRPLPILLVHGYFCNHAAWNDFVADAAARGYRCGTVDLEPITGDIDRYAALIEARCVELLAASGAPQVLVIGHSMGGLALRAWMRQYGDARVRHAITLGTPHAGTVHAWFANTRNGRQMRPASLWNLALAASETAERRALFTSIWTYHDNMVAPQSSAALAGAHNIALSGLGHVQLAFAPEVRQIVFATLAQAEAEPQPAAATPLDVAAAAAAATSAEAAGASPT